jgi:hypothetical protein
MGGDFLKRNNLQKLKWATHEMYIKKNWNYDVEQNIYKFLFCIVNSWDERGGAKDIAVLQPSRKNFHMNLDIDTDDWSCKEVNFRNIKRYGKQMFVFKLTFCILCFTIYLRISNIQITILDKILVENLQHFVKLILK